jgi:hypothetical protein
MTIDYNLLMRFGLKVLSLIDEVFYWVGKWTSSIETIDVIIPLHPVTAVKTQSTLGSVIKQSKLISVPNELLPEVTVSLPKSERVS